MSAARRCRPGGRSNACDGFSIIEGLAALALTGLIMAALSTMIAQWIPTWNRGFHKLQLSDLYGVALDRVVDDLSAATYVTGGRENPRLFFDGGPRSATFVRPVLDPGARPGLEIVRIESFSDKSGAGLVRRSLRFTPLPRGVTAGQPLRFSNSTIVLRTRARIVFSYAGADGAWRESWSNPQRLPSLVRIDVHDASGSGPLALSTTAVVHAEAPASCAARGTFRACSLVQGGDEGSTGQKGIDEK